MNESDCCHMAHKAVQLEAEVSRLAARVGKLEGALKKWKFWLDHFEPCGACKESIAWCSNWYALQDEAVSATATALEGGK